MGKDEGTSPGEESFLNDNANYPSEQPAASEKSSYGYFFSVSSGETSVRSW
jgi:hypothetical protein